MRNVLLLVMIPTFLFACGSDEKESDPCLYSFSMEITAGQNEGLMLAGALGVSGAEGAFIYQDAVGADRTATIAASAQGNDMVLVFTLPDGSSVRGTGPKQAAVLTGTCVSEISGTLSGPATGDSGDWIGTPFLPPVDALPQQECASICAMAPPGKYFECYLRCRQS